MSAQTAERVGDAALRAHLKRRCAERIEANQALFASESERLARLCHRMAERFARGGRLIALGRSAVARSDARHVAVEFVHPVIVGKRALPALALVGEGGDMAAQVEALVAERDMVMAFGCERDGGDASRGIAAARAAGALTIAFAPAGAEWEFPVPSGDPAIRQELVETLYHVLWELVHVFFEHRGLLEGRELRPLHDAGASSFLYPFLDEREEGLGQVLESVRSSALAKAREIDELRAHTLGESAEALLAAARALRESFEGAGKLLACGNGGSATDAADIVGDFREPAGGSRGHPALDLSEDPAILTAIANDVGLDAVFARQVIAYGAPGDLLIGFSTSGSSSNIAAALREARGRGLRTIAMVGYDGGRIAAEGLAEYLILAPSEHIPRIQEAHASASHLLRELTEEGA